MHGMHDFVLKILVANHWHCSSCNKSENRVFKFEGIFQYL